MDSVYTRAKESNLVRITNYDHITGMTMTIRLRRKYMSAELVRSLRMIVSCLVPHCADIDDIKKKAWVHFFTIRAPAINMDQQLSLFLKYLN